MSDRLNAEEVAILIKARQILKDKGLAKDADVKSICERAGVSRKTGYQWAKSLEIPRDKSKVSEEELAQLKSEQEALKERYRRLEIEHEGLKLAWEIHGVDELLAAKKNTTHKRKKKKR
jgi:transposase